jgi:hypothetical protein
VRPARLAWPGKTHRDAEGMAVSTKSVAQKLLIKPNTTIWSSPPERLELVGPLPEGVAGADGPQDAAAALVFVDDAASVREVMAAHGDALARPDVLWFAYPKGNATDINRDTLWPILGELGLRPIGQVSIDEVWSGPRFRPAKEGEAPFTGGRR